MHQISDQVPARQLEKIEKIKLIAYRLWVARREGNITGDAESDYFQAEQILESNQHLKRFLLGSFGFSAMAFVLGHSPGRALRKRHERGYRAQRIGEPVRAQRGAS